MSTVIFSLILIQTSLFAAVTALALTSIFMGLRQRAAVPARVVSRNRFRARV